MSGGWFTICRVLGLSLLLGIGSFQDGRFDPTREFVDALNGKGAGVQRLIEKHPTLKPIAAALTSFAESGSPFAFQHEVSKDENSIVIRLTNNDSRPFDFRLRLDSPKNQIIAVEIGPPDRFRVKAPDLKWTKLPELLDSLRIAYSSPAIGLALFQDGKFESAFSGKRSASGGSVQASDRWLIGSIGKSVTATVLGKLVDLGKLRWDSSLMELLPDVPMHAAYKKVTLIQLLRHRSGIGADLMFTDELVKKLAGGARTPSAIRANYIKQVLAREPQGQPGVTYRYSNAGYAVASVIAERVAKKSFEQLLSEYVFVPAGMKTAMVAVPGSKGMPGSNGQPMGHIGEPGAWQEHVLDSPELTAMMVGAGAGMAMSVPDLARYGKFHLDGMAGRVKWMRQATFLKIHEPAAGAGEKYACGWSIQTLSTGKAMHWHNGSDGTFHADIVLVPDKNLVVASISNCGAEDSATLRAVQEIVGRRTGARFAR